MRQLRFVGQPQTVSFAETLGNYKICNRMVVLAKSAVKEAAIRYPGCARALNEWYDVTRAASWKDFWP
jgi:hypothetical protein